MPDRSRTLPKDTNQRAKRIVDLATGSEPDDQQEPRKDPAAVSLGRRGGLKGGKARAEKLSPARRVEIARQAAEARYGKKK
jgi:hypothetical protein